MSATVMIEQPGYAFPTEDDPYYTWRGERLIRVTKPLELHYGDQLHAWHGKMAAARAVDLHEKWMGGEINDETFKDLFTVERMMAAGFEHRDWKGDIGTIGHLAEYDWAFGMRVEPNDRYDYLAGLIENASRYDPGFSALPEHVAPYFDSVLEFYELTNPEFDMVGMEAVCVSISNRHAGRMDGAATFYADRLKDPKHPTCLEILDCIRKFGDGKKVTVSPIDNKHSNSLHDKFRWQLAAYKHSDFVGLLSDGSEHPIPEGQCSGILWAKPEERTRLVIVPCGEKEYETFLAARDFYELRQERSDGIRLSRAKPQQRRTDARPRTF